MGSKSIGLFENQVRPNYVYAVFAIGKSGEGYIKFGLTKNLGTRMSGIRVGCPLEIPMAAYIELGPNRKLARQIEREFHQAFEHRRAKRRGEWFLFRFDVSSDKEEFNDVSRQIIGRHFDPSKTWWEKINLKAAEDADIKRRSSFVKTPYGRRAIARQKRNKRIRSIVGAD